MAEATYRGILAEINFRASLEPAFDPDVVGCVLVSSAKGVSDRLMGLVDRFNQLVPFGTKIEQSPEGVLYVYPEGFKTTKKKTAPRARPRGKPPLRK